MTFFRIAIGSLLLLACPPPSSSGDKPAGTPTDPVTECEDLGQVCKMGGSQLGVCNKSTGKCPGPAPCFNCVSQH